jgi:hypothetical protein
VCWGHSSHPSYKGSINRRIEVQDVLGKNRRPYSKITLKKGVGGSMTQVVENLPSKCEALSSNSSTGKKICSNEVISKIDS